MHTCAQTDVILSRSTDRQKPINLWVLERSLTVARWMIIRYVIRELLYDAGHKKSFPAKIRNETTGESHPFQIRKLDISHLLRLRYLRSSICLVEFFNNTTKIIAIYILLGIGRVVLFDVQFPKEFSDTSVVHHSCNG